MADENKTTEEELDQVEASEEEEEGLAEALGLSSDSDPEEDEAAAPESDEDEAAEEASDTSDDISEEEIEAAFVAPTPEEPKEEEEELKEESELEEESEEEETLLEDSEEEELEEDSEISQDELPIYDVSDDHSADGLAAYFDDPRELLHAAEEARDEGFEVWDAFSPFPIHGIEDAMGIGRSWLPWVTFGAGGTGFLLANALQFGTLTFDWPMIIGGKPHAPWPSFVPIMFELTVLIGGVTSALVMFIASGCFRKPRIIDPEITNDRFVLWIDSKDPKYAQARDFMTKLDPVEIRTVNF